MLFVFLDHVACHLGRKKSPLFIFYVVVVVVVVVIAVVVVVCIPLGRRLWRSREMIHR